MPDALHVFHCLEGSPPPFLLRGRKKTRGNFFKHFQHQPFGLDLVHPTGSSCHPFPSTIKFARRNQRECTSAKEVWGHYQMGNPTPHFAYSPSSASSHQTLHLFTTSTFLLKKIVDTLVLWQRSVFASVYCCSSPAMEVALTIIPLIT